MKVIYWVKLTDYLTVSPFCYTFIIYRMFLLTKRRIYDFFAWLNVTFKGQTKWIKFTWKFLSLCQFEHFKFTNQKFLSQFKFIYQHISSIFLIFWVLNFIYMMFKKEIERSERLKLAWKDEKFFKNWYSRSLLWNSK